MKLYKSLEVSEILGISNHTLTRYRGQGLPMHSHGKYDLVSVVSWFVSYREKIAVDRVKNVRGNSGKGKGKKLSSDERLVIARAEKIERENAEADKLLISAEDALSFADQSGVIINGAFESLGARLCNQLAGTDDPAEIQSLIWNEARDVLLAISDKAQAIGIEMQNES